MRATPRSGASGLGGLLPRGPGEGLRQHAYANAGHGTAPADEGPGADIEPDPRINEDVRPRRTQGYRERVRSERAPPSPGSIAGHLEEPDDFRVMALWSACRRGGAHFTGANRLMSWP